ncbi:MAG: DUF1624 domain-containing protein [Verrucomicrobiaceae bacterium]|nr:DUF1624 domain-containing protein [Verrucomicrobiaceae bacterium]
MPKVETKSLIQKPTAPRELWVDALRGLAVIGMVWTHCANTFLTAELQQTKWFDRLVFYHGLIAPTFFWVAGLMRGRSLGRSNPARPAVFRLLSILGLGYLLHTPWDSLSRLDFGHETWRIWLQMDVLQCLAVSGFVIMLVERCGKWAMALALLLMAFFIGFREPLDEVQTGWTVVDAMLNRKSGSLFPLFPWVAFGLAGFIAGALRQALGQQGHWWLWQWLLPGFVLAVSMETLPGAFTTLTFFLQRLGWVLMFAGTLTGAWPWVERIGGPSAQRLVLLAGRRSLTAYVSHLIIIYSLPLWSGKPLAQSIGLSCGLPMVISLFATVLVITLWLCWLLEHKGAKKERHPS